MRVGFLTSLSILGLATYSCKLCEALTKYDNVQILVGADISRKANNARIKIMRAWSQNSFWTPLKVLKIFLLGKVDVIHCQYEYWTYGRDIYTIIFPLILTFLKTLRKPIVVTIHGAIPRSGFNKLSSNRHHIAKRFLLIKRLYLFFLVKAIALLSSKIIIHSELSKRILTNDYRISEKKLCIIPHGMDPHIQLSINKSRAKSKLNLHSYSKVILCFGEIRRDKGIEYVIEAMPKVLANNPSTKLIIAGHYDPCISPESKGYLEYLIDLSRKYRLEKNLILDPRYIPDEEVYPYFVSADIVIFPYLTEEIVASSGPLSMAIAFSKPVVATAIKRFTEHLKNGENAILVPPRDSEALAKAINMLIEKPEIRQKISMQITRVKGYSSWDDVAAGTLILYNELIAK